LALRSVIEHPHRFGVLLINKMNQTKNIKKAKWAIGIAVVLGVFALSFNELVEWLVVNKIEKESLLPYNTSFKNVELRFWRGEIVLDSISLEVDEPGELQIKLTAEQAKLSGWRWLTFLLRSDFRADTFKIVAPELHWYQSATAATTDTSRNNPNSLIALKTIAVQHISIENGTARLYDSTSNSAMLAIDSLSTNVQGYTQHRRPGRDSFYINTGGVTVGELNWEFEHYFMQSKAIEASWENRALKIDTFKLIPQYRKGNFSKTIGEQKGRLDLSISGIAAQQDLFEKLLQKQIHIGKLSSEKMDFIIHKDKSVARRARHKDLPHFSLRQFAWGIRVDTTRLKDTYVQYAQYNPKRNATGNIDFQHSYISLYNVTNLPAAIQQKPFVEVDILSQFMGLTKLTSHFRFNLNTTAYTYHGTLQPLDLQKINPVLVPLAGIRLKSGQLHELQFQVDADDDQATGSMQFAYENLAITLLEKKGEKGLLSFLANTFVIKQKNLPGNNFRKVTLHSKRDKTRSIFHHIWHALKAGLRNTVLPDFVTEEKLQ